MSSYCVPVPETTRTAVNWLALINPIQTPSNTDEVPNTVSSGVFLKFSYTCHWNHF